MKAWELLAAEGNHDLIARLRRAELGEEGFGSIAVTKDGFSENDETHNAVMEWLKSKGINIINPSREIAELEKALHGSYNKGD